MKKSLLLIIVVAGLLAGFGLEARRGGGRRGGHRGGRHHGRRHGGWGRRGWGGVGFGLSIGGPRYYDSAPVVYLDDPYDWYWNRNPRASWDSYGRWLEGNSYRIRRPWKSYYGSGYRRRWRARPRVGFGIGVGF